MSLVFTPLATDTFQRLNENPLSGGGNWTIPANFNPLQVVGGQCVSASGSGATGVSLEMYAGISWFNDQYASFLLESSAIQTFADAIVLRSNYVGDSELRSGSTISGYAFSLNIAGGGYDSITLTNGIGTFEQPALTTFSNLTFSKGDTISFAVVGNTLYACQNGITVGTYVDPYFLYASGAVALSINTNGAVNNFTGGIAATPAAYVIEPWMQELPFTELIDLTNNNSYPMPYRVGAASLTKLLQFQTLEQYGGSVFIGTAWMIGMIDRQMAQTPGFMQIYASAPVIS